MVELSGYFRQSSYGCKQTLNSYYKKKARVKEYVLRIDNDLKLISSSNFESDDIETIHNRLLDNFTSYCECIYSCMEYVGYLLYKYQRKTDMLVGSLKGTQSSFHDMLNCYYDDSKRGRYAVFRNKELCKIIDDVSLWYYPLRGIRSKEAHYNTGEIIIKFDDAIYDNHVEYGEHSANSFELSQVGLFYSRFSTDSEKLITQMADYNI